MIKYTILASENGASPKEAFMESDRPLTGTEPIIVQRFEALEVLLKPMGEYEKAFLEALYNDLDDGIPEPHLDPPELNAPKGA